MAVPNRAQMPLFRCRLCGCRDHRVLEHRRPRPRGWLPGLRRRDRVLARFDAPRGMLRERGTVRHVDGWGGVARPPAGRRRRRAAPTTFKRARLAVCPLGLCRRAPGPGKDAGASLSLTAQARPAASSAMRVGRTFPSSRMGPRAAAPSEDWLLPRILVFVLDSTGRVRGGHRVPRVGTSRGTRTARGTLRCSADRATRVFCREHLRRAADAASGN
jgi:hypothetical protein